MTNSAAAPDANLAAVMRRVTKLLAIAGDVRADANEAAAAAQQAQKIMRKYQLDNSDLIEAELKSSVSAIKFHAVFANMKRDDAKRTPSVKNPSWGQFLAVAIARLNGCEARQGFDDNKFGQCSASLRFYGYHADVELCAYMFDYLVGVLIRAVALRQKTVTNDRLASEAYRKGFVSTLTGRLASIKADQDAAEASSVAGRGLVVSKQRAIAEAFGEFAYKVKKASGVRDFGSYQAGVRDGRTVDLDRRGVHGATSGAPQLN